MATVSTLTIDLVANSAKLASGLRKGSSQARRWAQKTRGHVNAVGKAFGGLAAASAVAFGAVYTNAARSADQLGKLSDQLGVLPVDIQALGRAAELTGSSQEGLNKALEKSAKNIGEARAGFGTALPFIKQLKLENEAFFNLRPSEQFKEISDRINELGSQQEKAAAASAFFGREGGKLLNTLALGSDGLSEVRQEVEDYGIALTRIDIAKIEAANDEFFRAKEVSKGFTNQLGVQLAPIVGAIATRFSDAAKEAGGMGVVAEESVQKLINAVAFGTDAVNGLKVVWLGVKAAIVTVAEFGLKTVSGIDIAITNLLNKIPGVSASVNDSLVGFTQAFEEQSQNVQDEFQAALLAPPPSEKIKQVVKEIFDQAQEEAEVIASDRQQNIGTSLTDAIIPRTNNSEEGEEAANDPFGGFTVEKSENALSLFTDFLSGRNSIQEAFDQEKNAKILALEDQLASATTDIEEKRLKDQIKFEKNRIRSTRSFFSQGLSDLAQNSKKGALIQKGYRAVEIVRNAKSAAVGSYNALAPIPYVGPSLGVAAAGAAIAFGAKQLSGLDSPSLGSAGAAPSIPSAASTAGAPSAPALNQDFVDQNQQQQQGTTINFFGDVSSNDPQKLAEDLKSIIDDGDFVLIENTSRNGLELASNAA